MSSLHKQVVDGILDAMRSKDKVRLATLRDAKSKFVLEQTKTGTNDELSDAEVAVLADFLPKAMSEEEIKAQVEDIISRLGASGMGDMGKVMGVASSEMAGRAEGKVISGFVREILLK